MFLDLSKAFDTLRSNISFSKLEHNGVRGNVSNWFPSSGFYRQQFSAFSNVNLIIMISVVLILKSVFYFYYFSLLMLMTYTGSQTKCMFLVILMPRIVFIRMLTPVCCLMLFLWNL
ncbi:hypothetical protein HOLleu_34638 [Holothuria leucospilota]|uniref:Uncharacterized protein n=1 Tax=Holothuria leucospilota TaxID=206669 RepID=A0A9Q0YNJ5_HOLLE|nr:hypothetical protein HOLleu_34638 [Holothuria leucospilota]